MFQNCKAKFLKIRQIALTKILKIQVCKMKYGLFSSRRNVIIIIIFVWANGVRVPPTKAAAPRS